jgi:limonene 1,2-monooxygenase
MRLNFGVFLSPYHRPGVNPNLALHQDLQMLELLDDLGFEEAWVGEHQSGGFELIAAPDVFIAAAAARTRRIRFGTGVTSIPYHHPLMISGRMTLLDHLTRGRAMFGMGPGSLVQDAEMMGMDYMEGRRRLEEGIRAIVHLLRCDEPLTMSTDWFELRDARLQLRPYSEPSMELAVAAVRSPTGPHLAGTYGTGMLSLAATDPDGGFDFVAETWKHAQGKADESGQSIDRRQWRLVAPIHIAPTIEEAIQDVKWGMADWIRFGSAGPFSAGQTDVEQVIATTPHEVLCESMNASGSGVYGTPDMAKELIQRLIDQSGGFGTLLLMLNGVADPAATNRSLELFAREVAPEFQMQLTRPKAAWDRLYNNRSTVGSAFRAAQDKASLEINGELPRIW